MKTPDIWFPFEANGQMICVVYSKCMVALGDPFSGNGWSYGLQEACVSAAFWSE
jgi:hypothetical protein